MKENYTRVGIRRGGGNLGSHLGAIVDATGSFVDSLHFAYCTSLVSLTYIFPRLPIPDICVSFYIRTHSDWFTPIILATTYYHCLDPLIQKSEMMISSCLLFGILL